MIKTIKVECKGAGSMPPEEMSEFQGELKELTDENMERLKKEMIEYGFNSPIHIWKAPRGKKRHILDGHARVRALLSLRDDDGYKIPKAVPVDYINAKNLKAAKHILLSRIAQYGKISPKGLYDYLEDAHITVKEAVESFRMPDIDMEQFEVKFFVDPDKKKQDETEDALPDKAKARCKTDDIWVLGSHKLMCGDATKDVDRLMGGKRADMVFTDPPYGINVVKPNGNIGGDRKKEKCRSKANTRVYRQIIGDDKPFDPTFLLGASDKHIIWGANNFASNLPNSSRWLVWDKKMPTTNDFSDCELAWTSFSGKTVKMYPFTWAGMTREGNRKDELKNRVHPTQKPVGLFANILNDFNPQLVLDPFGGSGSTLIACEKTNRKCYMMEIDPAYCDVIIERWEKYTGKKARKAK